MAPRTSLKVGLGGGWGVAALSAWETVAVDSGAFGFWALAYSEWDAASGGAPQAAVAANRVGTRTFDQVAIAARRRTRKPLFVHSMSSIRRSGATWLINFPPPPPDRRRPLSLRPPVGSLCAVGPSFVARQILPVPPPKREALCGGCFDSEPHLLQPPESAHEMLPAVRQKRRRLLLEEVPRELDGPPRDEKARGERQPDNRRGQGNTRHDHGHADHMTDLVPAVLVHAPIGGVKGAVLLVETDHCGLLGCVDGRRLGAHNATDYSRSLLAFPARVAPSAAAMARLSRVRVRPRKAPRQQRSREMVETLLDAGARVLIPEGYSRTTTNRVAQAAGVSVWSLYQYFPSQDDIVVALLRRHRRALAER